MSTVILGVLQQDFSELLALELNIYLYVSKLHTNLDKHNPTHLPQIVKCRVANNASYQIKLPKQDNAFHAINNLKKWLCKFFSKREKQTSNFLHDLSPTLSNALYVARVDL